MHCTESVVNLVQMQIAWRGHIARARKQYLWKVRQGIIADESARILQKVMMAPRWHGKEDGGGGGSDDAEMIIVA